MPWRSVFSLLSPAGAGGRLSVFIFHRVLPQPDPIFPGTVDVRRFDQIVGWLRSWFDVLPLDVAVQRLKARSLPSRAAAITFDDGYADNHSQALPVLRRHGVTATFFVATGFLDGGRMWNDTVIESFRRCQASRMDLAHLGLGNHALPTPAARRAAIGAVIAQIKYLPMQRRQQVCADIAEAAGAELPDDLMMSSRQVLDLHRAGMPIGAHTVSHPILARVDMDTAQREIEASRDALQALISSRVGLFAYPNGKPGTDYLAQQVRLVETLGFDAAVSTGWGAANAHSDLFQIPRFTPWDRARWRFGARAVRNLFAPQSALRPTRDGGPPRHESPADA